MASLRKRVKDLGINSKHKSQDFDPEDDAFVQGEQDEEDEISNSEDSVDEDLGREHYQTVGKSQLRKPDKAKLDHEKYGGQAVSRRQIFQDGDDVDVLAPDEDEDEDPFAAADDPEESALEDSDEAGNLVDPDEVDGAIEEDGEIDSDEAFGEGEEDNLRGKGFVFRGSGKDLKRLPHGSDDEEEDNSQSGSSISGSILSEEDQSDIDMEEVDQDGDEEDEDDMDSEDLEDEDESEADEELNAAPRPATMHLAGNSDREKLKALISSDTAALASSLSASLSADAKKGTAVKKQYQIFDRLLDARIKLQKGLTASNNLSSAEEISDEEAQTALQRAEQAALKLYSTIESLRHSILEVNTTSTSQTDSQPSKKRKRPSPPTSSTSTSDLWTRLSTLESSSLPIRNQTLDKWSAKTRAAIPSSASKLAPSSSSDHQSKLSTILTTYLHTETPKLLATSQPTPHSYDDSIFYQSLLRDLINSRAATASNTATNQSTIPVVPMKLHPSGNTAKNRNIDTKASKGRKIRYTVHEKLENFMASEGRGNAVGQWNDGAVREFFASLLGQRGMLGEESGDDDLENGVSDGEMDGGREGEALRLFRT